MNANLTLARQLDLWLARLWREAIQRARARRAEESRRRLLESASDLRERAKRYAREQPGYASDLRAALERTEHEIAIGSSFTRSL